MSDAAGELADRFHLLRLAKLFFDALALGDVAEKSQNRRPALPGDGRGPRFDPDPLTIVTNSLPARMEGYRIPTQAGGAARAQVRPIFRSHARFPGFTNQFGRIGEAEDSSSGGIGILDHAVVNNAYPINRSFDHAAVAIDGVHPMLELAGKSLVRLADRFVGSAERLGP